MSKRSIQKDLARSSRDSNECLDEIQFIDEGGVLQTLETLAAMRRPTLLIGEPGVGKTLLVRIIAAVLGLTLITKLGGKFNVSRLVGQYMLKAEGNATTTVFEDGPLVKAMRSGAIYYQDEIDGLPEDVYDLYHPVLDDRRELSLADIGLLQAGLPPNIKAHPNFWFVASCVDKSRIPADFLDRFRVIRVARLSVVAQRDKLAKMFPSLCSDDVERLARIGELTRKIGWQKPASFRQVIAAAQDVADGISIDHAIDHNLINPNVDHDMDRLSLRNAMEREGLGSTRILADTFVPEDQKSVPVFDIDSLDDFPEESEVESDASDDDDKDAKKRRSRKAR